MGQRRRADDRIRGWARSVDMASLVLVSGISAMQHGIARVDKERRLSVSRDIRRFAPVATRVASRNRNGHGGMRNARKNTIECHIPQKGNGDRSDEESTTRKLGGGTGGYGAWTESYRDTLG
jgi:hypothetical protein